MGKYVDSEKLIAKVKALKRRKGFLPLENTEITESYMARGIQFACDDIVNLITSLQQEQPEQTCKTCGFYENNCPFIRGKLIPYPNKVCKDYTYSAMKEQEQLEMDLDKFTEKIKTFQGRYEHPEIVSIKGAMAFMARMFYQYPNVARKWYEQLPKATMD